MSRGSFLNKQMVREGFALLTKIANRIKVVDKDFKEHEHPRGPDGEWVAKGGGSTGGVKKSTKAGGKVASKPKSPPKPKAPVKAQLYAKVIELGLEKGDIGKYKKASNAKLLALIAGTKGWNSANPATLHGLNPYISLVELKEIKKVVEGVSFSSVAEAKEALKKSIEAKKGVKKKVKSQTYEKKEAAEKAIKEEAAQKELDKLKKKALSFGIALPYWNVTKAELEEQLKEMEKTETFGKEAVKSSKFWKAVDATPQQRQALKAYTNGAYTYINNGLRKLSLQHVENLFKQHLRVVHYLDEILGNSKFSGNLYRGISKNTWEKLKLSTNNFTKSAIITDEGFGSFTKSEKFAAKWKPCRICLINGGVGLADISALSDFPEEQEVLAARGLQLRIKSVDKTSHILTVEIVGVKNEPLKIKDARDELAERPVKVGKMKSMLERWTLDEEDTNFFGA